MANSSCEEDEKKLVDEVRSRCQMKGKRKKNVTSNADNNNEKDFTSKYNIRESSRIENSNSSTSPVESGRISGGSQESAFSSSPSYSANEDDDEDKGSSTSSDNNFSTSSSRSSVADESTTIIASPARTSTTRLNLVSNVVPETGESLALIESVRVRFLESLQNDNDNDINQFDTLDIEELKKDLNNTHYDDSRSFRLISRFMNFQQLLETRDPVVRNREIEKACESLKNLLKFRHTYHLSSTLSDNFSKEFYILSGAFVFGVDRNQLPVLYLRARVHRRWSTRLDDHFRRYIAWQVDRLTKSHHAAKVNGTIGTDAIEKDGSFGVCFDCLGVSYHCIDMDFLRFLVRLLVNYYPTHCRYALCVDLPWLFRSVWKLVRSWLPEDAQSTVQLIKSEELVNFIDTDQIPNSMKINDLEGTQKPESLKHKLPENWDSIRNIDDFAKDLEISNSEMKQLKSHVERVRKEYEKSGAL